MLHYCGDGALPTQVLLTLHCDFSLHAKCPKQDEANIVHTINQNATVNTLCLHSLHSKYLHYGDVQSGACRHIIISTVYWPTGLLPRQVICIVTPFNVYHTQPCSAYHARPMGQMNLPKAPATGGAKEQENGNLSCRARADLGHISLNIYSQGQLVTIVRREWGECR